MVAGLLSWPQVNADQNQFARTIAWFSQAVFASKVDIKDKQAEVMREIDGGSETVRVKLPAVITADLRLNQPRFANLPSIQASRLLGQISRWRNWLLFLSRKPKRNPWPRWPRVIWVWISNLIKSTCPMKNHRNGKAVVEWRTLMNWLANWKRKEWFKRNLFALFLFLHIFAENHPDYFHFSIESQFLTSSLKSSFKLTSVASFHFQIISFLLLPLTHDVVRTVQ